MMRVVCTQKCRLFIFIVLVLLLFYYHSQFRTSNSKENMDAYKVLNNMRIFNEDEEKGTTRMEKKIVKSELKYILQWTSPNNVPFVYMGQGRKGFIDRKCEYTNCFVTSNRSYLGDYTKFDVIAFAGPELMSILYYDLPERRAPHQKYAFASIESSDNYPICSDKVNRYFNWTWTFVLDSHVRWGYMAVRNKQGEKIGPGENVPWIKLEDMEDVSDKLKIRLMNKTKAAAWFVSNCHTKSNREYFVRKLASELKTYNLTIDIYGNCGNMKCSRDNEEACGKIIQENYYFYLSFENSFSKDYVTEKLLHGLNNDAIPIVYGAANYTRFMPDGIYLNARELGTKALAAKMNELIQNPDKYVQYFRWKNHYTYHKLSESIETDPYCLFCTILNDEDFVKNVTVYDNFLDWWNPPGRC